MTDSNVNYTAEMVATISAQQPLNLAKAKKKAAPLKIDIILAIASALDVTVDDLAGLEKATGQGLNNLLKSIG